MITVSDIVEIIHNWAPPTLAWEKDNVGLLLGKPSRAVSKVLVALDLTMEIVHEAVEIHADTIVTHHPFIFHPIKNIREDTNQGSIISDLIKNDINVIAAHTNVDVTAFGLNYHLAQRLDLIDIQPLGTVECELTKLVFYLRSNEEISSALVHFLSTVGKVRWFSYKMESSVICYTIEIPTWEENNLTSRVCSLVQDHLISFQSQPLNQKPEGYGLGAYGDLSTSSTSSSYIKLVKERLNLEHLRTNCIEEREVKRVAVCGGAGTALLQTAINIKADVFITSDISYHTFFESPEKIIIIDAGHYETEFVFIDACIEKLKHDLERKNSLIEIVPTKKNTNPIRFM